MHICMCLRNKKANKNKILEFHLFLIIRYILNLVSQLQLEAKYRLWYSNVIKINFRKSWHKFYQKNYIMASYTAENLRYLRVDHERKTTLKLSLIKFSLQKIYLMEYKLEQVIC